MAQTTANHKAALAAATDALTSLQAQVRHVWTTVRWRVRWQGTSPAVLAYYHLPARRAAFDQTAAPRCLASAPVLGWHLQPEAVATEPLPVSSGQ